MNKHSRFSPFMVVILLATLALSACGSNDPTPPVMSFAPGIELTLKSNSCPGVTIYAGEQVTWIIEDDPVDLISIVSPDGDEIFESGGMQPGDSVSYGFAQAGTYSYYCSNEKETQGTITVLP